MLAALLAACAATAGCDVPTEPPDFEFTTRVSAPLLVDKTFVLVGPDAAGREALIDTTSQAFRSVFTVDPADRTLAIGQEIEGFDLSIPGGFLPTPDLDPIDLSFSAEDVFGRTYEEGNEIPIQPNGESFDASGSLRLDIEGVRFTDAGDYVELGGGTLYLERIVNEFDVALDEFVISIPSLRRPPYEQSDFLVVRFEGTADRPDELRFPKIDRESGPRREQVDLEGLRLFPVGNELTYHLFGRIETTDEVRLIRAHEELRLTIRMEEPTVSAVAAEMDPLDVVVSSDANGDGQLDVLDDREAQIAAFDGLGVFDDLEFEGFELLGSELRLNVRSNVAADAALFAVVLGVDEDGQRIYLEGKDETAVSASDPVLDRFVAAGAPVDHRRLIRLDLEGAPSPEQPADRSIVLDARNSNVDAFLSRAPTELRMAALLVVQPDGGRVVLREPFELDTGFGVRIPLSVASGFSIDRTFEADLSGLEDAVSDSSTAAVDEIELEVDYANGLPFGVDLRIAVLDEEGVVVVTLPKSGSAMRVSPGATDETGIVTAPAHGTFSFGADRADLRALSRGDGMRLQFAVTTAGGGPARLRADDTFTLRLRGSFQVQLTADGRP